ncbi:prepilin peptidase [Telmatospirillum siberiense]|uniref:Prepilin type IV endopeptidase peptidase domain-containing protein n=1 Tax=Telmatospirillum siberiense TaxID=382514 RepID=A0A2N3Q1L6_9PROT|nr:A24 family peptidase [Telmatospirillum siberiense]PKU26481.1 hypothetical protein CWS72_01145 [Telmatospirillum siberiense]
MTGIVTLPFTVNIWTALVWLPAGWMVAGAARWLDRNLDIVLDHGLLAAALGTLPQMRQGGEINESSPLLRASGNNEADDCSRTGYPVLEFFTVLLLGMAVATAGSSLQAAAGMLFCAAVLFCGWIDWRNRILPDVIVVPLLMLGLILAAGWHPFVGAGQALTGAGLGWGMAFLTGWLGRGRGGCLGAGDAKLLAAIGSWLGPLGATVVFLSASLSMGAVMALRLGRRPKMRWCFGPALAATSALYLLFISTMSGWHLQ